MWTLLGRSAVPPAKERQTSYLYSPVRDRVFLITCILCVVDARLGDMGRHDPNLPSAATADRETVITVAGSTGMIRNLCSWICNRT